VEESFHEPGPDNSPSSFSKTNRSDAGIEEFFDGPGSQGEITERKEGADLSETEGE